MILSSAVTVDEEEEEVKGEGARVSTVQLPPLQLLFLGGEKGSSSSSLSQEESASKHVAFAPSPTSTHPRR